MAALVQVFIFQLGEYQTARHGLVGGWHGVYAILRATNRFFVIESKARNASSKGKDCGYRGKLAERFNLVL